MLPDWMAGPVSPRRAPGRLSSPFLDRTLRGSARLVEEVVFAERAARRPGFLQGLDARVKLFSVLALLVAATFLHHLPSLWLLGAFAAVTAALSRLGLRVLFHRVWWFVPGVFVLVVLPAVLNVFTPGETLVMLYRGSDPVTVGPLRLPAELTITRQGAAAAGLLITRLLVGVLLAVTLTLTTRWQEMLKAAYTGVTAPFVFILAMMYRYLFVLLRTMENMHLARRARTMVPGRASEERRWVGGRVAALFSRSRGLSERVYGAMLARGYRGEPKVLTSFRFGGAEAAWVCACGLMIGLTLFLDRGPLGRLGW